MAKAVSRWLPTAAAQVQARVSSCGICGGQSGSVADFLYMLQFPLPILIPPTAPHSSFIVRGWHSRPVNGRRTNWTQSHPMRKKTVVIITAVKLLCNIWQEAEQQNLDHKQLRTSQCFNQSLQ
jgi:hypothetical protein